MYEKQKQWLDEVKKELLALPREELIKRIEESRERLERDPALKEFLENCVESLEYRY